jgi:hypothetical protein
VRYDSGAGGLPLLQVSEALETGEDITETLEVIPRQ